MSVRAKALAKTRKVTRMLMRKFPNHTRNLVRLHDYLGLKWYNSVYKNGTFGADITGTGVTSEDIRTKPEYSAILDKGTRFVFPEEDPTRFIRVNNSDTERATQNRFNK
jgi:hypothetical protein